MPRTARAIEAGMIYHVLNRGNGRMRLFHKPGDYEAFEQVLAEGLERYPVELFTYCVMPNHWHLVVRPQDGRGLGTLAGLGGRDARAATSRALSSPRRRASLPRSIQELSRRRGRTLSRLVPLRRGESRCARSWSSGPNNGSGADCGGERIRAGGLTLSAWPVKRPSGWLDRVNARMPQVTLDGLRACVQRGRPLGPEDWVAHGPPRGSAWASPPRPRPPPKTATPKNQ